MRKLRGHFLRLNFFITQPSNKTRSYLSVCLYNFSFGYHLLILFNRVYAITLHWCKCLAREYLPMGGSIKMIEESLKLAFGDNSEFIKDKRIAAVQALSGTGACRLFAAFQQRFHPNTQIYIPVPTWAK